MPFIYAVGRPGNAASGKPDPVYKKQHAGGYEGGFRQNSTIKRNQRKESYNKTCAAKFFDTGGYISWYGNTAADWRSSCHGAGFFLAGLQFGYLMGGSTMVETIFSWPGIGSLMIKSIDARDYPVVMGITVLVAIAVLVFNILTDLVYGILDPRIRYN